MNIQSWDYAGLGGVTLTATTPTITYHTVTEAGTAIKLEKKEIGPQLMFKFVKSKFQMNDKQAEWHKARIQKIGRMVSQAKNLEQHAAYEELSRILFIAVRESELMSFGIKTWVQRDDVTKFMGLVKDRVVFLKPLEEFPRLVPGVVQTRLKLLQDKKVFDSIEILYIDYTKQDIKSNSQKVREKDPIAFGVLKSNPDVMYYITDWVDEYCDITLSKFVDTLSDKDKVYELNKLEELSEDQIKDIVDGVVERQKRLEETKASNWRDKEREAIRAEEAQKLKSEENKKVPWYKRLFS